MVRAIVFSGEEIVNQFFLKECQEMRGCGLCRSCVAGYVGDGRQAQPQDRGFYRGSSHGSTLLTMTLS
jgi:hypothetical protein